jgi:glycosyltransferase involved in cell wall biosynthesis
MSAALFSVLVPNYNHEQFVVHTLESIYNQTYKNIELVVIDDQSSDDSFKILSQVLKSRKYLSRFTNLICLRNEVNKGSLQTILDGVKLCTGDFISIANSDDVFDHDRISSFNDRFSNFNEIWGFSRSEPIDADGKSIPYYLLPETIRDVFEYYVNNEHNWPAIGFSFINRNIAISTGNLVFDRKLVPVFEFSKTFKYCGDYFLALCFLFLSDPAYLKNSTYNYRVHLSNSFSSLREVGEEECDKLVILCQVLFQSDVAPVNRFAPSSHNFMIAKQAYSTSGLGLETRRSWRMAQGVDLLDNSAFWDLAYQVRALLLSIAKDNNL